MSETFSVQAMIFVAILVIYVMTSHVIENFKVPYLHQSTIAILMGILTATIARYVLSTQIQFSNELFFTIILPPIIFSAGYSLRKSLFFQNFGMIGFLGIIGTVIGFFCLTAFLFLINTLIFQTLTFSEILTLSSVLCATDTVAAMSLIKPEKFPVLNAVLFGEGILNDAVAIILYGTVSQLELDQNDGQFTLKVVMEMFFNFCYLFFFSLAFGALSGLGLSYFFKKFESFNKSPIKETSLILLNGYLTYLMGELLGLSGIITLFTCAIIMGHYSFMNISVESQKGTGLAFQTVSYMAQAFVFAYLGASILSLETDIKAIFMGLMIFLCLPFIRAIMVYILPLIYKIFRRNFPMNSKELKICWYSGMVRGVIAFALCLQIQTPHRNVIVTIGLVIVLVTTLIGSTFLHSFARFIGISENTDSSSSDERKARGDEILSEISSNYKTIGYDKEPRKEQQVHQPSNLGLQNFESKYLKPIFNKKENSKKTISYQMSQVKDEIEMRQE